MKRSGDEEICLSADKVGSNDDLLIEILLRLPVLSLVLFKSVSKRWLSLITDHSFTLLRNKNPNVDPPSGFLLQASTVFTYMPLNTTTTVNTSNFSFDVSLGRVEVLQSCNGLMLCRTWGHNTYYVYNPTTNLFKLFPLPYVSGMAIAFDPAVSPHYKLLYSVGDYEDPDIPMQIGIYSSETGIWSICAPTFGYESFQAFIMGIYWHDAIHWIDYSDEVVHFTLDLQNPRFIQVETPTTFDGNLYQDYLLSVSCDCLLLVQPVDPQSSLQSNVYEMMNDYSGWFIKYHVNLNHITPEDFNFMPDEPYFFVVCIVLGKRDEEPFLVLQVPGKLIQYNIISKTFHKLCDIQPPFWCRSTVLFTPSLAGV